MNRGIIINNIIEYCSEKNNQNINKIMIIHKSMHFIKKKKKCRLNFFFLIFTIKVSVDTIKEYGRKLLIRTVYDVWKKIARRGSGVALASAEQWDKSRGAPKVIIF